MQCKHPENLSLYISPRPPSYALPHAKPPLLLKSSLSLSPSRVEGIRNAESGSEMRSKASGFLKQILGALAGLTKAKSLALKSKTNALKARVLLLSLLRNRRLVVESISHKLHGLLGQREPGCRGGEEEDGGEPAAVVVCAHGMARESARGELVRYGAAGGGGGGGGEEEEKYPDPRRPMFELEDLEDPGGSVIDLVKNSKQEGEDFVLEDEIDRVADLFIRRFHRQIRMQKQLSLKRFNEALDRSPH